MSRPGTDARPLVSFVIASYNYGRFIGKTLQSILDQTVQDFEIVVVDDASTDNSREVVGAFSDPRICLHVNDKNIGLPLTYDRGLSLSRGEFVTYLDSDDWIEPRKLERQLEFFRQNSQADIVGTYINAIDNDGNRHPQADILEGAFNQPHDFNSLEVWTGWGKLIACSVLLRRAVQEQVGPRDTTMVIGSDHELWTRALAQGCRFGIVPEPLLTMRYHSDSVSARDTLATVLEVSYILQKNVLPMIEAQSAFHLLADVVAWHQAQGEFLTLKPDQRYSVLGLFFRGSSFDCAAYARACLDANDPELISLGKRVHGLLSAPRLHDELRAERDALSSERQRLQEERDALAANVQTLRTELSALNRARRANEAEALSGAKAQLQTSTSWRLTRPLQTIGAALRRPRPPRTWESE